MPKRVNNSKYFKASQGVNFCGYRIWKTHKLLRVQSKKKMRRKLKNFEKLYMENRINLDYVSCSPYRVPAARLAAAQANIQNSKHK